MCPTSRAYKRLLLCSRSLAFQSEGSFLCRARISVECGRYSHPASAAWQEQTSTRDSEHIAPFWCPVLFSQATCAMAYPAHALGPCIEHLEVGRKSLLVQNNISLDDVSDVCARDWVCTEGCPIFSKHGEATALHFADHIATWYL